MQICTRGLTELRVLVPEKRVISQLCDLALGGRNRSQALEPLHSRLRFRVVTRVAHGKAVSTDRLASVSA